MSNELNVGDKRLGNLVSPNLEQTISAVQLELTAEGIFLTLPIDSESSSSLGSWFHNWPFLFGDFKSPQDHGKPPEYLTFEDSFGFVTLLGLTVRQLNQNLFSMKGNARLEAKFGVLGRLNLDSSMVISGLRSTIPGSERLLANRSIIAKPAPNSLNLDARTAPKHVFQDDPDFSMIHGFTANLADSAWLLSESLIFESDKPATFEDHLQWHNTLKALLSLTFWETLKLSVLSVRGVASDSEGLDPSVTEWFKVVSRPNDPVSPPKRGHNSVFRLDLPEGELLPKAITWMENYSRGMSSAIDALELQHASLSAQVTQLAIAFEMASFRDIELEIGSKPSQGRYASYLKRIVDVLPLNIFSFDLDHWLNDFSDLYNGTKHADRESPDFIKNVNTFRRGVQVLRAWIAISIGVAPERVKQRLAEDPLSQDVLPA